MGKGIPASLILDWLSGIFTPRVEVKFQIPFYNLDLEAER
jgi:hypothetical protein